MAVRRVGDIWPRLDDGRHKTIPINDDPVSPATPMDNTERLNVAQDNLDAERNVQVPADMPSGPGSFEPAGGNSKFAKYNNQD